VDDTSAEGMSARGSTLPRAWRGWAAAAGMVLAAFAGLALVFPPLDAWLVPLSYDAVFSVRNDVPTDGAVIVYMDEESHRRLGQSWNRPWDRSWHARLIQRLGSLGARVIAFDVLFAEPGDPAQDAQLVAAAQAFGKVVLAAKTEALERNGLMVGWHTRRAFPALAAVTRSGAVTEADHKRIIRKHYYNPTMTDVPSLASSAAELAGQAPAGEPGERWINYYGPPGYFPHLSYCEVFETNSLERLTSLISNRVVFVGARFSDRFTGGKETDDFRTPHTRWSGRMSPGVEINATCYLNLVRGDWLTRLPPAIEAALIVLIGLGLGWSLGQLAPIRAVWAGIGMATGLVGLAFLSAWSFGVWVPWGVMVLAQLPIALGVSILGQSRRLIREKRAFEQALALASEGRGTTSASGAGSASPGSPGSRGPHHDAEPAPPVEMPQFLREFNRVDDREGLPRVPDHELLRRIGSGGYGEVWLARDILGSYHAVKMLSLQSFKNATPLLTEFEGLRRYTPISRSHPGLVHVLHVGRDEAQGCLYYVMELADDEKGPGVSPESYAARTLARDLERRGRLPLLEVLSMGVQLADALEHLHRHQLVHRDVKPANIVFVKGQPKLADIGLVTEATSSSQGGLTFLGTPGRIAPEGAGSPAADIFSLGKVLYETGLGMALERFPELPADMIASGDGRDLFELNRIIMKACDTDWRRRHGSAAELRDALAALRQRLTGGMVSS
jgi:CHASE2 domain-containing sensor protein